MNKIVITERQFKSLLNLLTEKDHRGVMVDKMGISKELADVLHGMDDKRSLWLANEIIRFSKITQTTPEEFFKRNSTKFKEHFNYIMDWVKSPMNNESINWKTLTFTDAYKKSEEFHKKIEATSGGKIDDELGKIVIKYPDGFYWIELTQEACRQEAESMAHCGVARGTMYSLRRMGQPFISMDVDMDDKAIMQTKGKSNSKPKQEYHKYILDFIQKMKIVKIVKSDYKHDLNFRITDIQDGNIIKTLLSKTPLLADKDEIIELYKRKTIDDNVVKIFVKTSENLGDVSSLLNESIIDEKTFMMSLENKDMDEDTILTPKQRLIMYLNLPEGNELKKNLFDDNFEIKDGVFVLTIPEDDISENLGKYYYKMINEGDFGLYDNDYLESPSNFKYSLTYESENIIIKAMKDVKDFDEDEEDFKELLFEDDDYDEILTTLKDCFRYAHEADYSVQLHKAYKSELVDVLGCTTVDVLYDKGIIAYFDSKTFPSETCLSDDDYIYNGITGSDFSLLKFLEAEIENGCSNSNGIDDEMQKRDIYSSPSAKQVEEYIKDYLHVSNDKKEELKESKSKSKRPKSKGKICPEGIAWAKRTYDKWPSAYASMGASKYCKDKGKF